MDKYTKAVLTVIAVCLVIQTARIDVVDTALASSDIKTQLKSVITECYGYLNGSHLDLYCD